SAAMAARRHLPSSGVAAEWRPRLFACTWAPVGLLSTYSIDSFFVWGGWPWRWPRTPPWVFADYP
ncbi:MAG: hypothetical protein AMJ93_16015, partial [Anaerolineae bacterium SM23_84]